MFCIYLYFSYNRLWEFIYKKILKANFVYLLKCLTDGKNSHFSVMVSEKKSRKAVLGVEVTLKPGQAKVIIRYAWNTS